MEFGESIETVGRVADVLGVAVIVVGVLAAGILSVRDLRSNDVAGAYRQLRQRIGRTILLGLELLVAADIIRTVAVSPTLENAAVLAIIVAIRTALSFSLEVELEGRWPWQSRAPSESARAA